MARITINELKKRRLADATAAERAEFDETYAAAALAIRVGEQIRDAARRPVSANENSPLGWEPARPQSPGSRPVASARRSPRFNAPRATLDLDITVELRPAS